MKTRPALVVVALLIPQVAQAQNQSFEASTRGSINASSAQSSQASQVSSIVSAIVLGAGLLAGVGGGITTTMYRRDERARRLAQPPPPAPVQPPPPEMQPVPYPDPSATPPPPPPPLANAPEAKPGIEAMIEARWWLLANEVQLKQDLALGAGPAIDDLAGLARIAPERRAYFGKVLQRHRALLSVPRDVTPEQAAQTMARVGELVLADPILRVDGEAVLAAL